MKIKSGGNYSCILEEGLSRCADGLNLCMCVCLCMPECVRACVYVCGKDRVKNDSHFCQCHLLKWKTVG